MTEDVQEFVKRAKSHQDRFARRARSHRLMLGLNDMERMLDQGNEIGAIEVGRTLKSEALIVPNRIMLTEEVRLKCIDVLARLYPILVRHGIAK